MASSEGILMLFQRNMCNVELMYKPGTVDDNPIVGVRIRPWDKQNKDTMIIASGETIEDALNNAFDKARQGRWEDLDFAKRPWAVSRPPGQAQWSTEDPESAPETRKRVKPARSTNTDT